MSSSWLEFITYRGSSCSLGILFVDWSCLSCNFDVVNQCAIFLSCLLSEICLKHLIYSHRFGSARAVNRRYIGDCVPVKMRLKASAAFVSASALGMASGPALAGLLTFNIKIFGLTFDSNTLPGWIMVIGWLVYLFLLLIGFKEPSHLQPPLRSTSSKKKRSVEGMLAFRTFVFGAYNAYYSHYRQGLKRNSWIVQVIAWIDLDLLSKQNRAFWTPYYRLVPQPKIPKATMSLLANLHPPLGKHTNFWLFQWRYSSILAWYFWTTILVHRFLEFVIGQTDWYSCFTWFKRQHFGPTEYGYFLV